MTSQDLGQQAALFNALSHPVRLRILGQLFKHRSGRQTVGTLHEACASDITLPAVSKHLKTLERERLIVRTIEGRQHWIRLEMETLTSTFGPTMAGKMLDEWGDA